MKIKSLRLKNFQSAKDLTFQFPEKGVIRFSGPNNIGKSVVLKGISTVMRNASDRVYKEFIRDDEDTFEIISEDFEDNRVHLSRGAVDFYDWEVNGVKGREDRTRGKVPEELRKYFNLYIEEEKTKECLNVRLPDDLLLYVNTTPGDTAMMFQKALGTEEYMKGIKHVDKKGRELKKELRLVEKYLEKESSKLHEVEVTLKNEEQQIVEIERYEEVLKSERDQYLVLVDMETETEEYMRMNKHLRDSKEILDELSLEGIEKGLDTLEKLTDMSNLYDDRKNIELRVKENRNQLENCDFKGLDSDIALFGLMESTLEVYSEVDRLEDKLSNAVNVTVDEDLGLEIQKLQSIEEAIELAGEVLQLTRNVKSGKEKQDSLGEQIKEIEMELGVCPTCGVEFPHKH